MSKHLVLSFKPYDFTSAKGDRFVGAKISYVNKKPSSRDGEQGHTPLMVSISNHSLLKEFDGKVPAIYEMEFEQVTGKNNKPEIILTDVEYLSPVDFSLFFQ